jgi:regulatory protein
LIKEILHKAIALLARREHSSKELMQKLTMRGYMSDDIKDVLHFLQQENYQSDIRAAEAILRNRVSRGYGWRYIENEMSQKGVSSQIKTSLYQEHDVDWYHQAQMVYQKKYADTMIADQNDKAKRMRFLQYRGFSSDEIMTVLNTNSVNKNGCEHD